MLTYGSDSIKVFDPRDWIDKSSGRITQKSSAERLGSPRVKNLKQLSIGEEVKMLKRYDG